MQKNNTLTINISNHSDWVTIQEAVRLINSLTPNKLTAGDIYRHALHENIRLSIYFQSPIILRRVKTEKNKIKLRPTESSLISRLCFLNKNYFINDVNLMVSTESKNVLPKCKIIDTTLTGLEYIIIQRLLALSLGIPLPVTGANDRIHGISVEIFGEIFLLFEKITWQERINKQIDQLPQNRIMEVYDHLVSPGPSKNSLKEHFPVHQLPKDACFVIRDTELEKLINLSVIDNTTKPDSTRISTPLSRMFWLACKHNEAISPLIKHPYKLLSIFEQWASDDGITDRFSGDTLKTALERGSPSFPSD
ncbi:Uncharacterised protein [Klebsiella pneumoniae]|uniref:hypothetical protein n=1 Tax=Klebsiella pneumoniae TaxID=573 RepID=UPI0006509EBD|nr:hypothetical protein [Klebsiella pneumoniae]HBX3662000.1 hypothetical protein [Klebsiella pneumoniae subsp. pneumoniae]EKQ7190416.1 hypothetical protein [Klebsiella pneumoniae]EKQ7217701.1 hypothetical protein [Klebsiella pneumoniae]EKZ6417574.1 hypothetical protein [Klebsiella pneumoniae]EKZ6427280.1 hypothetical protein [Klebsiella pneumoniae]